MYFTKPLLTYCRTLMHALFLLAMIATLLVATSCDVNLFEDRESTALGEWITVGKMIDGRYVDNSRYDEFDASAFYIKDGQRVYWHQGILKRHVDANGEYRYISYHEGSYKWSGQLLLFSADGQTDVDTFDISFLSHDSLVLSRPREPHSSVFKRLQPPTTTEIKFDEIEYVTDGQCEGYCPEQAIIIRSDDTFEYTGGDYARIRGTFEGELPKGQWNAIAREFSEARFDTLSNVYDANVTDLPTVWITLRNRAAVVKEVVEFGLGSPMRFSWAVGRVVRIPRSFDNMKLNRIDSGATTFLVERKKATRLR